MYNLASERIQYLNPTTSQLMEHHNQIIQSSQSMLGMLGTFRRRLGSRIVGVSALLGWYHYGWCWCEVGRWFVLGSGLLLGLFMLAYCGLCVCGLCMYGLCMIIISIIYNPAYPIPQQSNPITITNKSYPTLHNTQINTKNDKINNRINYLNQINLFDQL